MGALNRAMLQNTIIALVAREKDEETIKVLYDEVKNIILPIDKAELQAKKNLLRQRIISATEEEVDKMLSSL